jgi:hypothetical protein
LEKDGVFSILVQMGCQEAEKKSEKYLKIKKMSNQEYLENELLLTKEDLQKRM